MEQNEQYTYIDMANVLAKARSLRDQVKLKTENTFQRYSPTIKKYQELESLLDETLRYVREFIGEDEELSVAEEPVPVLTQSDITLSKIAALLQDYAPFKQEDPIKLDPDAEQFAVAIRPVENIAEPNSPVLSSSTIMKEFASGLSKLEDGKSYMPECAYRCASLMMDWFECRYTTNSRLHYKAQSIQDAVDKFIFAYGAACNAGEEGDFYFALKEWMDSLPTLKSGMCFHIPLFIQKKYESQAKATHTWQAIVIEYYIKQVLYHPGFYLDKRTTIRDKVLSVNPNVISKIPEGVLTVDVAELLQ